MDDKNRDEKVPPAVFSADPEECLEEEIREHPENEQAKVDVGSDESMDASDPISAARHDQEGPVPSSGFPEEDDPEGEGEKDRPDRG